MEQKELFPNVDDRLMLQRIKQNVQEIEADAEVWLYGSRARQDARRDSDWDVLVLSSKPKLTFQETGQVIQLFAYGKQDWHTHHVVTPFYQNVQTDAIRL